MVIQRTFSCDEEVWELGKAVANKHGIKLARFVEQSIRDKAEKLEREEERLNKKKKG